MESLHILGLYTSLLGTVTYDWLEEISIIAADKIDVKLSRILSISNIKEHKLKIYQYVKFKDVQMSYSQVKLHKLVNWPIIV